MNPLIGESQTISKSVPGYMLQKALEYLSLNFSVIPIHLSKDGRCTCGKADCAAPGKHPVIQSWRDYQKRRPTEAELRQWWKRWPWANLAIITGSISGLLVLDIDGPEGVEALSGMDLPHTVTTETGGGGWHYLFKYPEGKAIGCRTDILPKVDIRADGGYIVAPPSIHKSGKAYTWFCEPGETELADIPGWLLELLDKQKEFKPAEPVTESITEGARNSTLASLAGSMRRRGMSQESITAALEAENQAKCKPPLPPAEVAGIAASVCKYPPAETQGTRQGSVKKGLDLSKVLVKPDTLNKVEIDWIIPNFLPAGYVSLFVGDPKAGKTWLSLRLAAELSRGGDILDGLFQTEAIPVLYIMADTGPQLVNYRLQKTGWEYNENNLRFVYAEGVRTAGADLNLSFPEGWDLLNQLVVIHGAKVIFLDTLTSLHSSDESNNREMSVIISKLRDLAIRTGAGLFVLHHSRKKKRNEMNIEMSMHDSVGASVLSRLVGNIIGIERRIDDGGTPCFLVRPLASWFREFKPFSFNLRDEYSGGRDWVRMIIDKPEVEKNARDAILIAIKANYWSGEQFTRAELAKRVRFSDKTISLVLNQLVEEGILKTKGSTKGKVFYLPREGELLPK